MRYENLQQLIQNSNRSRAYFLSLPVESQYELHQYNDYIHSAAELHSMLDYIQKIKKLESLGGWNSDN